jgi:hypothetical protein
LGGGEVPKVEAPDIYSIYRLLCHGKFGQEIPFFNMKWPFVPWALFHHLFLLLDFPFLDFYEI